MQGNGEYMVLEGAWGKDMQCQGEHRGKGSRGSMGLGVCRVEGTQRRGAGRGMRRVREV